MIAQELYTYPYVNEMARNRVKRWYKGPDKKLVADMPPIVVAFLVGTYGCGGYPCRREGKRWIFETMLTHTELEVMDDCRAQLRVWSRGSGPQYEAPAIDRPIACCES